MSSDGTGEGIAGTSVPLRKWKGEGPRCCALKRRRDGQDARRCELRGVYLYDTDVVVDWGRKERIETIERRQYVCPRHLGMHERGGVFLVVWD